MNLFLISIIVTSILGFMVTSAFAFEESPTNISIQTDPYFNPINENLEIISLDSNTLQSSSDGNTPSQNPIIYRHASPKQQVELRVLPGYVKCNIGLTLILKLVDYSPACVKPETFNKLIERGWGSNSLKMQQPIKSIKISGTETFMDYSISGGEVLEVYLAPKEFLPLRISLMAKGDGEITIKFPRLKVDEGCIRDQISFDLYSFDQKTQIPFDYMESPISHYLAFKFLNGTKEIRIQGYTECYDWPIGVDVVFS